MSNVVGLSGPTVDTILKSLEDARAAGDLTQIMVATLDANLCLHVAFSQMTNERALWMAEHMKKKAMEEQA